jgi:hypothetical protein
VCDAADSYGAYKKQVSMAVRQRDMHVAQTDALQQSTLARYLPMLGPDFTAVPNTMQPYLAGIGPTMKSRLKLQFRSGTAAVAHRKELVTRHSRRQETVSSQCPCCGHGDETHQHAALPIAPTMQSCGPSCVSNWYVRLGKRKYQELGGTR